MFKAFLKDSVIYTIPSFISRGLGLILIPLYTRVLAPSDFGSLDLFLVFANLVNISVALEVSQGVARFYASEPSDEARVAYASSGLWFTLLCYTVFASVAMAFSGILSRWIMGRSGMASAFNVGVAYIWVNAIFYLVQNQFRWELRSKQYAIISVLMTIATAGMAVFLTYVVHLGLAGFLAGMAFGAFVGAMTGLWLLRHTFRFRFSAARLKEMLAFSSPLVLSGISVIVSTYIDRVMIRHFLSVHEVGLYGIGFRLASAAGLLIVGFQGAFVPLVYKHFEDPDTPRQMARIFRVFVAIALMLFLVLSLFSREILVLMTTPAYYQASSVVGLLVPAILLSQMYFFASGIGITKKSHYLIWINLIGAVANAVLTWLLIPLMGIKGAAMATLIGYGLLFSIYMITSQRLYPVPYQWGRISLATTAVAVMAWGMASLDLESTVRVWVDMAAVCVAGVIMFVCGMVQASELRTLKAMSGRLLGMNKLH